MTLSAERLSRAKKDIADVVAAFEGKNDNNISQEGHLLLTELKTLDDAVWASLLERVEDRELHEHLYLLRQILADVKGISPASALPSIRKVSHMAAFDFSQRALMVNLLLRAGEQSMVSRQDLGDTLWIGKAVLQVVSDVMRTMDDTLSSEAQSGCIGEAFEENLKRAEDIVGEIRRIFTAVRRTDEPHESS